MAENLGVEPSDRITTVYGLAIRCITVLPALDMLLYSRHTFMLNLIWWRITESNCYKQLAKLP